MWMILSRRCCFSMPFWERQRKTLLDAGGGTSTDAAERELQRKATSWKFLPAKLRFLPPLSIRESFKKTSCKTKAYRQIGVQRNCSDYEGQARRRQDQYRQGREGEEGGGYTRHKTCDLSPPPPSWPHALHGRSPMLLMVIHTPPRASLHCTF
jgi:hypothetical protein